MSDIIDRIDELVDESLASGEMRSDYLNNDPAYPKCPHCNRHWHGLRITERIANMYSWGRYDDTYSAAQDDSAVLCEGSDFIGPQRPPWRATSWGEGWTRLGYISDELRREINWSVQIGPPIEEPASGAVRVGAYSQTVRLSMDYSDWLTSIDVPSWFEPLSTAPWVTFYDEAWNTVATNRPCEPPPDVDVQFGPQNWVHEFRRIPNHSTWCYVVTPNTRAVARLWDKFTAPDYPVPVAPGIDYEALKAQVEARPYTGPPAPPLGRAS